MLLLLSIRNFVIVDRLDIEFNTGFTVFTGETGAGKSILIDALTLVLGARGDSNVIREGANSTDISAEFQINEDASLWLVQHAFQTNISKDVEEKKSVKTMSTVLLRRVIDINGRSRAFINGIVATLSQMRELGEMLVDIHGQHAHQLLTRSDTQRQTLDTHAELNTLANEVTATWKIWQQAQLKLNNARDKTKDIELEKEQLIWQLNELESLNLQEGEWETLNKEYKRLSNATGLIDGVKQSLILLSEADESILNQLANLTSSLRKLANIDDSLNDVLAALDSAEIQSHEASRMLNHYAQDIEFDSSQLKEIEDRLSTLHDASRKFKIKPENLIEKLVENKNKLDELDAFSDLEALIQTEKHAQNNYQKLAKTLSQKRLIAARALSKAITEKMQTLSMVGGCFKVELIKQAQGTAYGLEKIEFLVAGHPGVTPQPLAKVASGGELARISLALSVVISTASPTPTLIFDEVDAGIGGAVAEVVGNLLQKLGEVRQVLCVTHLPQVAARGHHHFCVSKKISSDKKTISTIDSLTTHTQSITDKRINEIARMLGGVEITSTTIKHAKEMLTQ